MAMDGAKGKWISARSMEKNLLLPVVSRWSEKMEAFDFFSNGGFLFDFRRNMANGSENLPSKWHLVTATLSIGQIEERFL